MEENVRVEMIGYKEKLPAHTYQAVEKAMDKDKR